MADDSEQVDAPPAPEVEAPREQRAVAKLEADGRGVLAILPRDLDEAARYAFGLIRAGIVPDSYREGGKKDNDINAPLVIAGVLKSMELGLPPQTGLGTIYPINGKFTVFGDGAVGLIQRNRLVAKHIDRRVGPSFDPSLPVGEWPDEYGWTVSYWRVGQDEPYVGSFTVRDAKRANLWMNSYKKPWIMYPDRMLFNRARAFALRDGFADALMGLGIYEEVRDMVPDVDGGELTATSRHLSALDDEPDTAPGPDPVKQEPPADLLNKDF